MICVRWGQEWILLVGSDVEDVKMIILFFAGCQDCKRSLPGDCQLHGPLLHVEDRPLSPRAVKTAPPVIEILPITQTDHGDALESGIKLSWKNFFIL
jgi:hypothetical protein